MGKIFIIMGKSATGKDTVAAKLRARLEEKGVVLKEIVDYTTRPMRENEVDGEDYHFATEEKLQELKDQGKVIECRCYQTIHGPWYYFNVDDGQFDTEEDCLLISTIEGFAQIRNYFGSERVIPLYLEISDRTRLHRAMEREDQQSSPKYAELCRRFLADNEDFSEEKILAEGIRERYSNEDLEECLMALEEKICQG